MVLTAVADPRHRPRLLGVVADAFGTAD
jgi:hypothetical protein